MLRVGSGSELALFSKIFRDTDPREPVYAELRCFPDPDLVRIRELGGVGPDRYWIRKT